MVSQQLDDQITQHAQICNNLKDEVGRVLVGQEHMVSRLLIGLLTGGHMSAGRTPGSGQDADHPQPGHGDRHGLFSDSVHARHAAGGRDRHGDLQSARVDLHGSQGPDFLESDPGRRNQPRSGQGPGRAAGSDAGAAGHDRVETFSAGGAVPGPGDAESDRAGRDLSAARGPGRPVHAEGGRRLSDAKRRNARSSIAWAAASRSRKCARSPRRSDILAARADGRQDLDRREGARLSGRCRASHAESRRNAASPVWRA